MTHSYEEILVRYYMRARGYKTEFKNVNCIYEISYIQMSNLLSELTDDQEINLLL